MTEVYYDKRGIRIGTVDSNHNMWFAIPGRSDECQESPGARVTLEHVDYELEVFGVHGHEWRTLTYNSPDWVRKRNDLSRIFKNQISHQGVR